jgi:hypothetical protein
MQALRHLHDLSAPLRCEACGDVIGVYEPLVLVSREGGWSLRTSLVVTPDAGGRGVAFHAACYMPEAAAQLTERPGQVVPAAAVGAR